MWRRLFGRIRVMRSHLRVAWYAWRHPDTPFAGKIGLMLLALYVLSPIDLIPDALPVLGWLDDLAVLGLLVPMLLNFLPAKVISEARKKAHSRNGILRR